MLTERAGRHPVGCHRGGRRAQRAHRGGGARPGGPVHAGARAPRAGGGCCVTEEIAPGCRASTTSYIASMLRPEVIRDLRLGQHGLRMIPVRALAPGGPGRRRGAGPWGRRRANRRRDQAVLGRRRACVRGRRRRAEGARALGCSRCSRSCRRTPGRPGCAATASCCGWAEPARRARHRARRAHPAADRQPRPVRRRQVRVTRRRGRWCWPTTCTASTAGPTSLARCSAWPFTCSPAGSRPSRGSSAT